MARRSTGRRAFHKGTRMAREYSTEDTKIEQKPPANLDEYLGDVVIANMAIEKDYAAALAMAEEPVTVRIEPGLAENSPQFIEAWCNGERPEIFINGRWARVGFLPVNTEITIKRKMLEIIARAKVDRISTPGISAEASMVDNTAHRHTSAIHAITVIHDANPKGQVALAEMRRRNF